MRRVQVGLGALALLVFVGASGCGNDGATSGGTATIATSEALAPWCDDLPLLATEVAGSLGEHVAPDEILIGVLNTYSSARAETYAGMWIDQDHGGTVVLAFTDDVEPHREAILELRPSADDISVEPPPSITDTTTVEESGVVIDVVEAQNPLAELDAAIEKADTLPVDLAMRTRIGLQIKQNRVFAEVIEPNDDDRALLAEALGVELVCVTEAPPGTEPAEVPTTMSAEELSRGIPLNEAETRWQTAADSSGLPTWRLTTESGPCIDGRDFLDESSGSSASQVFGFATALPGRDPASAWIRISCGHGRVGHASLSVGLAPPVTTAEAETLARLSETFVRWIAPDASDADIERLVSELELDEGSTYEVPQVEVPAELPPSTTSSAGGFDFVFGVRDTPREGDAGDVNLNVTLFDM